MEEDGPTVIILLLGDPSCGKSAFLSRISLGAAHLSKPAIVDFSNTLPTLRDFDQPYVYHIRMYNRSYRFEFYDTASPDSYTLLRPDFIILCYDVSDRKSLNSVRDVWSEQTARLYLKDRDDIPIMLLGLKRDLRVDKEGVIYPQEASQLTNPLKRCTANSVIRGIRLLKIYGAIYTLNALQLLANSCGRYSRTLPGKPPKRRLKLVGFHKEAAF